MGGVLPALWRCAYQHRSRQQPALPPFSRILQIRCRAAGQWFQSESGLHQNWMRDYDPTTGRYLQADPLGLVDGASVYGYALQNPGRYTDPTGEFVPVVVGILIGFALDYAIQKLEETCSCAEPGFLPSNKYTALGAISGATGAFVGGKTGGVAGGGRSGHRTSVWSKYGGKTTRYAGRKVARKLPYVGVVFVANDLWRMRKCF
ncbi:RHS repeat-associated core domain-containing protein [Aliiroseovarius lamellibrachiae]|uniref:RHS repeat-associated core domain-containing protein n=1 Tax=Aliiroseovarius lamellibrachiae TaxID=1924933 RepID=UPI003CCE67C9|nr:RHS repeat-associated core domain-containing protein [Aliiroseovarius lamellibrachiae]